MSHNSQFALPVLPSLLLILPESEAVVRSCSARKVFLQILQNSQENTKKRFRYRFFLVNSAKFLITTFLKRPSNGCFCINTCSVYFPTTTFHLFKIDVTHIFWLSIFFGLICRLGTKVNPICKTLSQKPIFILVKYLGWNFSCEKVNSSIPLGIFAKKSSIEDVQPCSKCASVRCSH